MKWLPRLWVSHGEAVGWITLLLFMFGALNIFSASFVHAGQNLGDSYYFLKRHLLSAAIGMLFMLIMIRTDYKRWQNAVFPLGLVTFAMLVAVHFIGVEVNGARRWLNLGFQFQPSELAKFTVMLFSAVYLGRLAERGRRIPLFTAPLLLALLLGGIVLKQPDMGTAVIIVGIALGLQVLGGMAFEYLVILGAIGGGLGYYLTFSAAYRAERYYAWQNPWDFKDGIGYQAVQGLLAIGSGGFWGSGLGMGASKFDYLPEAHTDFAFAVLCQEMGFVGAAAVLLLFLALGYHGIKIALQARDAYGKFLAMGVVFLIVGQGMINMAMVTNLLPVVGVPLPFISFGGTSLLVNMTAIGLLLNVNRQGVRPAEPEATLPGGVRERLQQSRRLSRVK
ncbi:putative peptidoglycan glycosyltransferase FtsW [Azotosporobacter soli]|uniref:FtsW/RodA/SpoVE family cell cycle protein n=1 Tax=Azotosporobacter soli TaxID=3055040 RepID=UPI0031FE6A9B